MDSDDDSDEPSVFYEMPPVAVKEGYLVKQGGRFKTWRRRFFRLGDPGGDEPAVLTYHVQPKKRPAGIIQLDKVLAVQPEAPLRDAFNERLAFCVQLPHRTYHFLAASQIDMDEWIQLIEAYSLKRANRSAAASTLCTNSATVSKSDASYASDSVISTSSSTSSVASSIPKASFPPPTNPQLQDEAGRPVIQTHVCSGYLTKLGAKVKNWKRRWFVLKGDYIFYYRSEHQPGPLGMIDMNEVTGAGVLDRPTLCNGFDIVTSARTFVMQADTLEDRDRWIRTIGHVLARRDIRAIRDGKAEKVRTLSDALNSVVAPILQRSRLPEGFDSDSEDVDLGALSMDDVFPHRDAGPDDAPLSKT